ncbi:MAG: hydantoinase/oxoprolinase family protein [Minwuia sp.]|uniref:hydantoinase/oxoprolinase family protein n=1 Tax=Minwuia sp. TaxID=2493630 RepID=UPI003A8A4F5D
MSGTRVGVEVGGTFTDLVAIGPDGSLQVAKVPSTPSRPDEGALNAIEAAGLDLAEVGDLVHGSTVATNAILERKGARVMLVTTEGMRDILYIQRHNRRRIYDLAYAKPEPVVRRSDVIEASERVGAEGAVVTPLDVDATLERIAARLSEDDSFGAVAICFLNAFVAPDHEQRMADAIRGRFQHLKVTCSSDVCREFREYERASTTALAAYVQPVIDAYLGRFSEALSARGHRGNFSVMQSNGGRLPAEGMARSAITALFSGPAAGVVGAARQAARSGFGNIITFDMGGTSTDVCLVRDGQPDLAASTEIDGLPVKTPVIDIATVGAGGGSIIWIDDGGLLRAGPESAGADPGPACYGRGGERATITDCHLVRGTIRAETFLGGDMKLDKAAAEKVLSPVAEWLGLSLEEAADAAIRVAEASIVRAIQRISTERGHDPRDFALAPFGGAGPMLACRIAEELGIGSVIVSPAAGVMSAYGLLASDFVHFESRTHQLRLDAAAEPDIRHVIANVAEAAAAHLRMLGLQGAPSITISLDMRYVGQAFEIAVELPGDGGTARVDEIARLFAEAHHRVFEFDKAGGAAIEIVAFRARASVSPGAPPELSGAAGDGPREKTGLFERGQRQDALCGGRPAPGEAVEGPALIEDGTSTLLVASGWGGEVDDAGNLVLRRR